MVTMKRMWLGLSATLVVAVAVGCKDKTNGGMDKNMPGMQMEPASTVTTEADSPVPGHTEVTIPSEIQQHIGVTVGQVEETDLKMSIRAVGIIKPDETKVAHVHLKTEGWVQKLFVDFTGQSVQKGDPLLAIYSQQFLTTQQDYLIAKKAEAGRKAEEAIRPSNAASALRRLELLDVPADEIEQLERSGTPHQYLTLRSPLTGTVIEKNAFAGQYLTPQTNLYVLADLSTVWVQAKVYEYELPHIEIGQAATVTLAALPEREFSGKVVFIEPTVDEHTRTAQVRIELPNPGGSLKPGIFAHVVVEHSMGKGLLVPASAVIQTGERDIVYRVVSPGRFQPVEVKIAPQRFGDRFQVMEGLEAGDKVTTSANFLIDSESRLRVGGGAMAGG